MSVRGKILHKEEGFTIRENKTGDNPHARNNKFPSVIQHECEVEEQTERTIRKIWQGTWSADRDGVCQRCHVKIPDALLTCWKLHNWDALVAWYGGLHGKD